MPRTSSKALDTCWGENEEKHGESWDVFIFLGKGQRSWWDAGWLYWKVMWKMLKSKHNMACTLVVRGLCQPSRTPQVSEIAMEGVKAMSCETGKELHLEGDGICPGLVFFIFYSWFCDSFFQPRHPPIPFFRLLCVWFFLNLFLFFRL